MAKKWYENESLVKFSAPCNISIIGSTSVGKTWFTKKILENADAMFSHEVEKIFYFHGSTFQSIFREMEKNINNIHFHEW